MILFSSFVAAAPEVGPAGCVAVDGVFDFDLDEYVFLGYELGPCGTCWGRERGNIFEIDCQGGFRLGGESLQSPFIWMWGFLILIFIIIIISLPKGKKQEVKKEVKKETKPSGALGVLGLICGILGILTLPLVLIGFTFGCFGIFFSYMQKKIRVTTTSKVGFVMSFIVFLIDFFIIFWSLGILWLAFLLLLIFLLIIILKRRKSKK